MYWYRAEMALGRPAIVGSTVKQPEKLPGHLLADEKHTWALGQEVYVPTTVGGGCILGATVTEAASADALEVAYGEFAQEACALSPTYSPKTVCTDGWEGTQSAWRSLFPTVCIVLCFLHSVLKIAKRCGRDRATRTLILAGSGRPTTPAPGRSSPRGCAVCASGPMCARSKEHSGRWSSNSTQRPPVRARVSLPGRPSPLQRARSAYEPSGPALLRDALSAWHARCRSSRRTCHGLAVELPPLRSSLSPRRPDSTLSVPRPQRLRVPSQLAPQPAHRLLHGRAKTMNHEIR